MALTATANKHVENDIQISFKKSYHYQCRCSMNHPNVTLNAEELLGNSSFPAAVQFTKRAYLK